MRLVLLGPPGAGKGTLAELLKERFGLLHISTGDILREEIKNKTRLGLEAKNFIDRGGLVPDEVVTRIIEDRLAHDKRTEKGFILDGFPRTLNQAKDLDKILARQNKPIDFVIDFKVSEHIIIMRLTGLRICRKCGAIFHMRNKPPRKPGICNECAGELYQRDDDKEATIKKRLEVYEKNTTPLIQYYEAQGKVLRINSDKDSKDVLEDLMKPFNEVRR